ncbi:twin-arginine translocase TatA/TatE family subunit [Gulosibacter sp. 10]|uniref:twin-arginine translocase TatA/TatE family subunit n=1 Tax=Gulosibacter sp. 10 TaxID=1255570 RepID=UPI00097E78F2|nr:twin-arginine translocase TatA/TatE family subunit [Gulosibacter sp. 10]SJM56790.1 Twin-arginine translocation protein TatB [Gulosibacter sp. 10]
MGGLTFEKLLLIGIIAVFIFGPDRLPKLAEQLAQLIKRVRSWTDTAKTRVSEELGEDFTDEDWRRLDPRQYDPRRIIRDAWNDVDAPAAVPPAARTAAAGSGAVAATAAGASAGAAGGASAAAGAASAPSWAATGGTATLEPGRAPFDDEAT